MPSKVAGTDDRHTCDVEKNRFLNCDRNGWRSLFGNRPIIFLKGERRVTKPTNRPRGRPKWKLETDTDRYLVSAYWAIYRREGMNGSEPRLTRRGMAMFLAAVEKGDFQYSASAKETIATENGTLQFGVGRTRAQFESGTDPIVARADDLRRKAERCLKSDPSWIGAMEKAFDAAFYGATYCLAFANANHMCARVSEQRYFDQVLAPFIYGRFYGSAAFRL
jgi:hypothetical protein